MPETPPPIGPDPARIEARIEQWHRYFGLLWMDRLENSPFEVEFEKDLSVQQEKLDVVIVRRREGELDFRLPDGLDFTDHNLITYKSHHESCDDWTLKELTGHYVSYRKLVSPRGRLVAEENFRMYAVCARSPANLFRQCPFERIGDGVYVASRGSDRIRLVVANELPKTPNNSPVLLFSNQTDRVEYGQATTDVRSDRTSRLLLRLFGDYRVEGLSMPYTLEDFMRDTEEEHTQMVLDHMVRKNTIHKLVPLIPRAELLKGIPPEERVKGLPPEDLLKGLLANSLSKEQIEAIQKIIAQPKMS
jgi:hypothetical protein